MSSTRTLNEISAAAPVSSLVQYLFFISGIALAIHHNYGSESFAEVITVGYWIISSKCAFIPKVLEKCFSC